MGLEIERKFLVDLPLVDILWNIKVDARLTITQAYLPGTGDWTVRVRRVVKHVAGKLPRVDYYSTMKKKVTNVTCVEIEQSITRDTYEAMLEHCGPSLLKTRYTFTYHGSVWELDHFTQAEFDNLVVAEIELEREDAVFAKPPWITQEVTADKSYKNAKMVKRLEDNDGR